MSLISTIRFVALHPLNRGHSLDAVARFVKWQVNSSLNPYPMVYPFTDRSSLIIQKGMAGATGNLYCGLHEFEDMSFLLHFLRKEDLFVDVGANVGSYTILSAAHIGAETISIEPVPETFEHLMRNVALNRIQNRVMACNIALGSSKGVLEFTSSLDTVNHVATPSDKGRISVPVDTLDDIVAGKQTPILLKIDVEGFETEVMKGASKTLLQRDLKGIIIELNGSGSRYGYDEGKIHQELVGAGFAPYSYQPFERKLNRVETYGTLNTIYIRDIDRVNERIKEAAKIKIRDHVY